jgi:hypothetical protein
MVTLVSNLLASDWDRRAISWQTGPQQGVQCRYDLCALANRGGDAFH